MVVFRIGEEGGNQPPLPSTPPPPPAGQSRATTPFGRLQLTPKANHPNGQRAKSKSESTPYPLPPPAQKGWNPPTIGWGEKRKKGGGRKKRGTESKDPPL